MPYIDVFIDDVHGVKDVSTKDLTSVYWELNVHPDSKPWHFFITSDGNMQPTCTAHGGFNNVANFQECVEAFFKIFRNHLFAWPDDLSVCESSEAVFLATLRTFLGIFVEYNLVLSLLKSTLY